jgi:hypothetical protein
MASAIILKVIKAGGVEFKYHRSLDSGAIIITLPQGTQFNARVDAAHKVYILDDFTSGDGVEVAGIKSLARDLVGAGKDYQFLNPADELVANMDMMSVGGRSRRHKRQRRTRKGKRRSNGRKTR